MPNSSNPLNVAVYAMLIMVSIPLLILGAAGSVGGGGEIWWIFPLLFVCGLMIIGSSIAGLVRWRKSVREEEAATRTMLVAVRARPDISATTLPKPVRAEPGGPAELPEPVPAHSTYEPGGSTELPQPVREAPDDSAELPELVLAHWTYEPDEWTAYARREIAYRRSEAVWLAVGIAGVGTVLMGFLEGEWGVALGVSAAIGGAIGVLKWLMALSAHHANLAVPRGEVILSLDAILMNGHFQVLQDHTFHFGGVRLLENERPHILEFTVKWKTRNGWTNEQYRVPVPAGKEEEARGLLETYRYEHAN